ncbi:nuclear pore complex protein nup153, putative [Ixodes scapularis]|uniref:Nuclear pore complex protein Nup153 n=1 Tax=Ixodes scapularis TaxID=6945 RepID=B7PTD8_IXOSC|nr:nuclear pore complex protein nup153, putative [Ixodes scapularis]|eukprot:XP_002404202.1 nuclear pore complex protein nup153, putative [Ixodes scapularis]
MAGKLPSRLQGEKAHSSKPYERRKTLVQTVKELLLPSWLTSWNTPLVTEEEADNLWPREEASAAPDQSAKRPRTERPAAYSFAEPQDPQEELAGPQSLLNGDSHSEKSEASGSTSGCSSLGGPERESAATPEPRARRHDWSHTRDCGVMANLPSSGIPDRLRGGNGHAESASRQSPATPRWRVPQRTASGGQGPGFSLSAFGTPVTPGGRERQRLQSPFYPGRTTYGGAASYSRFRLATGGTPKAEAKKVPLDRGSGHSLLSYMDSQVREQREEITQASRPALETRVAPKDTPAPAPATNGRQVRDERRVVPGPRLPCSFSAFPSCGGSDRAGGKVSRTRGIHSSRRPEQGFEDAPLPPDLPDIPLPIGSLPSFTFQLPAPTPVAKQTSGVQSTFANVRPTAADVRPAVADVRPTVTDIRQTVADIRPTATAKGEFALAQPLTLATASSVSSPAQAPSQGTPKGFGDLFRPSPATWECDSCMVRNEAKAQRCCACETPRVSPAPALWEKFKPAAGSWSCSECMISNAGTAVKCAACETPRPGAPPAAPTTATATAPASTLGPAATEAPSQGTPKGFGDLFRPSAATWECDTCMVRNEAKAQRCCACETPKVSPAPGPTGTFKFGIPTSATPATPAQTSAPATFKFGNLTATSAPTPFKFGTQETSSSAASPPVAQFKFGSAMLACKPQGPLGQDATFGQKVEERAGKPPAPGSAEPPKTEPAVVFGAPKTESSASPAVFSFVPSSFAPKRKSEVIAEAPEIKASMPSSAVFGGSAKTGGTARDSGLFGALAKASVGLPPASTPCPGGATAPKVADSVASAGAPTGGDSQKVGFSFDKLAKNSPTAATFSFGIPSKPTENAAPQGSTTVAETKTTATSAAPASVGGFSFGAPPKTSEGGEPPKPVGGTAAPATQPLAGQGSFGEAKPKASSGGFKFGTSQEGGSTFAVEAPQPAQSTPFSFGATPAPAPVGGGFSFGASQPAASQPAAPAFSFNAGVPTPAAPRLDFAQPSASPFGAAPPAAPAFAFGGPMAAPAAPQAASFQFGASAPNQGGVFRFGAPSQGTPESGTQPQPGGFNFSAAQPAALGAFGQQQQPGANPSQGGFGFNAAAPANLPGFAFPPGADNPFSATGTGGTTQARRIRKAIRRKPNQPR